MLQWCQAWGSIEYIVSEEAYILLQGHVNLSHFYVLFHNQKILTICSFSKWKNDLVPSCSLWIFPLLSLPIFAIVLGLAVVGNGENIKLAANPRDILRCVFLFIDHSIPYERTMLLLLFSIQYVAMIPLTSSISTDGKHTYCISHVFTNAQI